MRVLLGERSWVGHADDRVEPIVIRFFRVGDRNLLAGGESVRGAGRRYHHLARFADVGVGWCRLEQLPLTQRFAHLQR